MAKIFIGVPCFKGVSARVYCDHFRLAFHLGRRVPEHEFFIAPKPKTEQFRARNAMVEQALQLDVDYLWMLDDDMILDINDTASQSKVYDVVRHFVSIIEDPKIVTKEQKIGAVGVLYYQRGGDCLPVMMRQRSDGKFTFLKDHEVKHGLQDVDVAGGGSLFIDMRVFDYISPPYFGPEFEYGTDIQICQKIKDAGFRVVVDSSVEFGHEEDNSIVVNSRNRHMVYAATQEEGIMSAQAQNWYLQGPLQDLLLDGIDYLQMPAEKILTWAAEYGQQNFHLFPREGGSDLSRYEYYKQIGNLQVARQIGYHYVSEPAKELMEMSFRMLLGRGGRILDYACGCAPIGFEAARHGAEVHFVDIEGAGAFEFLKWRLERHSINGYCYDSKVFDQLVEKPQVGCVLLMDALEHFADWRKVIDIIDACLMSQGAILTNYFKLGDDPTNVEHISMDREAVQAYLVSKSIYPLNHYVWIKNPVLGEGK